MMRVGFLVAGIKGLRFFTDLSSRCETAFVSSYQVKGTRDDSFSALQGICRDREIQFVNRKDLAPGLFMPADLIFVVGWQYLLPGVDGKFVIFHDSLLPRYRGFAPTVTALINGERTIGVTALYPSEQVDRGPIYAQSAVDIVYPLKIQEALDRLGDCYLQAGSEVLQRFAQKTLVATPQDESAATYSLWRDEEDYFIDWSWPAEKILRFVDAVGWPYDGAKTKFRDQVIVIETVAPGETIKFEDCHPGKFWRIADNVPEVVCGDGTLKILAARYNDGRRVVFDKLRERLVTPGGGVGKS